MQRRLLFSCYSPWRLLYFVVEACYRYCWILISRNIVRRFGLCLYFRLTPTNANLFVASCAGQKVHLSHSSLLFISDWHEIRDTSCTPIRFLILLLVHSHHCRRYCDQHYRTLLRFGQSLVLLQRHTLPL